MSIFLFAMSIFLHAAAVDEANCCRAVFAGECVIEIVNIGACFLEVGLVAEEAWHVHIVGHAIRNGFGGRTYKIMCVVLQFVSYFN